MELRGYKYKEDSTAQLFVSYVVETTLASESENLGPMGLTPTANAAMVDQSRTWSRNFRQGILILEIEDQRNNVLWSSEGVMDISRSRGGNVLDVAVRAAFRKFPDKTKLMKTIDKALIFANQTTHQVRLNINGEAQISAEDIDLSTEFNAKMPCEKTGDDIIIGFNGELLNECLKDTDGIILMSAPNRAVLLTDSQDDIVLLMPLMLKH